MENLKNKVIIRDLSERDFEDIENIIADTWHYNDFCTKNNAEKLSGIFLYSCLDKRSFAQVAELDGKAVGIIMGRHNDSYKKSFKYKLKSVSQIISLVSTKSGRKAAKIFLGVNGTDNELLKETKSKYDGEVVFFAVDKDCRGYGVGKSLFNTFTNYMKQKKANNFFLFTDTSCNYKFYEHQNLVMSGQKNVKVEVNGKQEDMQFFIYEGNI